MIDFILENNNFYGKYYNQVKGTAMCTKCAPTYATKVLEFLEDKLYENIEEIVCREFREYFEQGRCS